MDKQISHMTLIGVHEMHGRVTTMDAHQPYYNHQYMCMHVAKFANFRLSLGKHFIYLKAK